MRFLHTSDWHLGRTLHGVDLLDAQRTVLEQLCRLVAEPPGGVPVDAVLIAGDVYDRAVPPVESVTLFADVLAELTKHSTVIVTGGNHDSAIRLGFGSRLFTDRLRVHTELASIGEPVLLSSGGVSTAIYPLPYLDPDEARYVLAEDDQQPLARSHQAVMAAALRRVRADLATRPGVRSVLLAHAFVIGGAASDSERSIVVGGVDSVGGDTFAGIDYVALGHLHGGQQLRGPGGTVLRYSGSPLRYSFSERQQTKSVTLVDLPADGPPELHSLPLAQPREMAELTGLLADLLTGTEHAEDWVRLVVTDRARPDRLFDRVKSRYPHVLRVDHLPAGAEPAGNWHPSPVVERDPRELAGDFIAHVTGVAAAPAELQLFSDAYEKALAAR
jgi:exonuclease SbcD